MKTDYRTYHPTKKEWVSLILEAALLCAAVAYLFYRNVIAIIPTEGKPVDYINKEVGLTFNGNVCHVFSKDDQLNLEY